MDVNQFNQNMYQKSRVFWNDNDSEKISVIINMTLMWKKVVLIWYLNCQKMQNPKMTQNPDFLAATYLLIQYVCIYWCHFGRYHVFNDNHIFSDLHIFLCKYNYKICIFIWTLIVKYFWLIFSNSQRCWQKLRWQFLWVFVYRCMYHW